MVEEEEEAEQEGGIVGRDMAHSDILVAYND